MKRLLFLLLILSVSLMCGLSSATATPYTGAYGGVYDMEEFTGTYQYGSSIVTDRGLVIDEAQGNYLGTVYGKNDSEEVLLDFLINFAHMDVTSLMLYGKTDDSEPTMFIPEYQTKDGSDDEMISGTWQTFSPELPVSPMTPDVVDLIVVKGSTSFSVHLYDPAAFSGEWNIGYLDENGANETGLPSLSHISAYTTAPAPVPEPATMILLGMGLVGFAGVSRKKNQE